MYSKKSDEFSNLIGETFNLNIHHKKIYLTTLKQIWGNQHPYEYIIGLEKWLMIMVIGLKMLMPSFWIRHYSERSPSTKWIFELYVITKPIFFFIGLALHWYSSVWFFILSVYLMSDLISYIIGVLTLSDIFVKPLSIKRNLILLGSNYMEFVFGFAILYLHFDAIEYIGSQEGGYIGPIQAIYYSMSTFSTVGYGDIASANNTGMIITILQLICGIVFIGIILSSYVGKIKLKGE